MNKWSLLTISDNYIFSTERLDLELLRQKLPSVIFNDDKSELDIWVCNFVIGEHRSYENVKWAIMKYLCDNGWEPFCRLHSAYSFRRSGEYHTAGHLTK